MRFMLQVRANHFSESGRLPDRELIEAMFKFNEVMTNAGVMRAAEGLQPSVNGARVVFDGSGRTVVDGPFPNTQELIAGFWIIDVGSKEDAVDWAKRVPFAEGVVEIRQIHEMEDFGPNLTPELQAAEDRIRARLAKNLP
jgi:hypothetical protein